MERHAEAEEALRKSLALRPQSENAWLLLLELLEFMGRTEELAATVREGLAALPDSPGITCIGVKPMRREGRIAEAIAQMERGAPKLQDNQLQGVIFFQELGQLYDRAGDADSERDFDTYGLVYYGGYWYAVGHCYLRRDMRTFRLDRVRQVRPANGEVRRPPGFDALEHLRLAVATVPRKFAAKVLLLTDLDSARRAFIDTIGLFEQTADGVLLHNQSDELAWLARQLAAAPFDVQVLEPEALRIELRTVGERLLRAASVR